jgi:sigma-B regulation protein RsbU (phosphoserine phosphatase)
MQIQTNPYLIWQIIPALATLWLGIYVRNRPRKKPASNALALLLFSESAWSLFSAIQLFSPNSTWQNFWHTVSFLAIVIIPTALFLLAARFTGYLTLQLHKARILLLIVPMMTLLAVFTNSVHHLFFVSTSQVSFQGFSTLTYVAGPLFLIHTWYSYALVFFGVFLLGTTLVRNFKKYGIQAYSLIIAVLAPLFGNVLYLTGSFPPGFPDPTPLAFTITSIAIAWAIFSGRLLDVVPIAHEVIIADLSSGIIVLDQENKIMDINPAASRALGFESKNIYGRDIHGILTREEPFQRVLQPVLSAKNLAEQSLVHTMQGNKNTYNIRVTPVANKYGQFSGRVLHMTDITHLKQVELSLATHQENLASLLDTLKDYYFETDVRGIIVNINKAFYEHLGYKSKDDLIGKHLRHFTDRRSVRDIFLNFNRVIDTRETIEMFRYVYRTRDGREFIGETTVSPIMDGDNVIGARGLLRNITEKVIVEENLRRTKEDAENRVRELSAINRIATVCSTSLELDRILTTLCVELTQIFPVRNAGIGLAMEGDEMLKIVAFHSTNAGEANTLGKQISLAGGSPTREAMEKKKAVIKPDHLKNGQAETTKEEMQAVSGQILIVPLIIRGSSIGTIGMHARDGNYSFSDHETELAETIAIQIATTIDNANLYAKSETALGAVRQDLEIGRQIQAGFFPDSIPDIPGWEIAAHFEPARQVSGDFYDFYKFENSELIALVIADVCDKGVGAALFMVLFRSLLRAFGRMEVKPGNAREQLKNIISNTNNYIAAIHGNSNMFATMFFGILDPGSGSLYYINGGHLPPAIMDKDGRLVQRLPPTGPAVGLFRDVDFKVEKVDLARGDFLVGFTDGTTDAQNEDGQLFTEERLLKYVQTPWSSLFSMMVELKNELHQYKHEKPQFDDITLISIRRKLSLDRERHAICRVADAAALTDLVDFTKGSASICKLDAEETVAVTQAVEAACRMIIKEGFGDNMRGLISLFFETDPEKTRIIIRDDGKALSAFMDGNQENGSVFKDLDSTSYGRMDNKANELVLEKELHRRTPEETEHWNYVPVN